jgi:hypothetical protein
MARHGSIARLPRPRHFPGWAAAFPPGEPAAPRVPRQVSGSPRARTRGGTEHRGPPSVTPRALPREPLRDRPTSTATDTLHLLHPALVPRRVPGRRAWQCTTRCPARVSPAPALRVRPGHRRHPGPPEPHRQIERKPGVN